MGCSNGLHPFCFSARTSAPPLYNSKQPCSPPYVTRVQRVAPFTGNQEIIVKLPSVLMIVFAAASLQAQDTTSSAQAKPMEHVIGTVTDIRPADHIVNVKEDGGATTHVIDLTNTKTL